MKTLFREIKFYLQVVVYNITILYHYYMTRIGLWLKRKNKEVIEYAVDAMKYIKSTTNTMTRLDDKLTNKLEKVIHKYQEKLCNKKDTQ